MNARMSGRGAVDLGALAAARQNEQRAAEAMANAPAGVVIDVTTESFERDVIQQSMTVPVLIDLWATWCGPCKQLSPVLERLAAESGGRWVLAKVDVDAEPAIAQAFQVQSIPTVFLVIKGQPGMLFQGAEPEARIRAMLDEVLKLAEREGITGRVGQPPASTEGAGDEVDSDAEAQEEPLDPRFAEIYAAMESGDWAAAEAGYRSMIAANPADSEAAAGLATVGMFRRTSEAAEPTAPAPDDVDAQLLAADYELIRNEVDAALQRSIGVVRITSGADRDKARARVLDYFLILGDHESVPKARAALSNALF